jgi:hypothetical protein
MRNDLIWSAQRARSMARTVCSGLLLFGSNLTADMQTIMLSEAAPAASDLEWKVSATVAPGVMMILILGRPRQPAGALSGALRGSS